VGAPRTHGSGEGSQEPPAPFQPWENDALTSADGNQRSSTTGAVIHWAARYDLLVWLLTLGRESVFREKVIRLARLGHGESVLDVGCGTGTLAIAAKRAVGPTGTVCGIDASPEMIDRARKKAIRADSDVVFEVAVAEALPFRDGQFDAVLASLVFHHLPSEARQQCFRELRRVLKPGGRLLAVDLGGSRRDSRGFIGHFHSHTHFDLAEIIPRLGEAGLNTVESGPVEFGKLQFVLAK
jgi:ubiquinone/menaquinone biosynthesis C-methylase UbiE